MTKNLGPELNTALVEKMFAAYPKLEWLIFTGTVSKKASREILGIDKYEFDCIYLDLLEGGAIYGSGSNCYRATQQLKDYMKQRKEDV